MGTKWSEIISENAMTDINDVRLIELAQENPARFFRKMALYMKNAIPIFNRPPEIRQWLELDMTLPSWDEASWVSTGESTMEETQVATGKTGYSVFSCVKVEWLDNGEAVETTYHGASYDAETGIVTFAAQDAAGVEYSMDFYRDGAFAKDLTATQKRILGLCVASTWDEHFFRDWLADVAKAHDRSFEAPNEPQYMEKSVKKKMANRSLLNEELRKYEQDCAYYNAFRAGNRREGFV